MMHTKPYYVYILASRPHGTLYIGFTSNIERRIQDHKNENVEGFTKKYAIKTLVHLEMFHEAGDAIQREKQLKKWNRKWKIKLIEKQNPYWKDLNL